MMNTIITIIIIVVSILAAINNIKAKQKTKKGTTPSDTGGLISKLNAVLNDIQKRIEQPPKESSTGLSGWRQLLDGAKTGSSQTSTHKDSLDDLKLDIEEPGPVLMKTVPPPARTQKIRSRKKPAPPPDVIQRPAQHTQKVMRSRRLIEDRDDLRRAVVLSEILGPPIALRDQPSDRR